jgi:hypothetical protein
VGGAGGGGSDDRNRVTFVGDVSFADEHSIARLFAIGYRKGLIEAVYSEQ